MQERLFCDNNGIMLEKGLIEHCSATLAGLKSANLFNHRFSSRRDVLDELEIVNGKLNRRGVFVDALRWRDGSVLIYAYRKNSLEKELMQDGAVSLLSQYGYESCDVADCIELLKQRLAGSDCFPHEIGLFLGYPLPDVIGFIQNKGKNCKCCGPWKVYCNEHEAMRLFDKIKKCADVYSKVFSEGRCISKMTVCV